MRQILTIFILIFFSFCKQKNEQTITKQKNTSADSINKKNTRNDPEKIELELTALQWQKHEDSLRKEILKHKENKTLKNSFLEEMYIRDVVRVVKDSVLVNLPFNLHGPDCGSPDCYSTDISFSFPLGNTLIFPKDLQFKEYENGCVNKERQLKGKFHLIEENGKHVIYHAAKQRRTLVLFSSNKENGTTAYYFTNVGQNIINARNVYSIVEDYDEENKNSIYPFTCWVLTTNEYENFLYK